MPAIRVDALNAFKKSLVKVRIEEQPDELLYGLVH